MNRGIVFDPGAAVTFLEICCGTGSVLSANQREFPELALSVNDIFTEGLVYAEERVTEAAFFQMDAGNIPFELCVGVKE